MISFLRLLQLLPILVAAVELLRGARHGELKRELVERVFWGLVNFVTRELGLPSVDTPTNRQQVRELIDQVVGALHAIGVFRHSAAPPGG